MRDTEILGGTVCSLGSRFESFVNDCLSKPFFACIPCEFEEFDEADLSHDYAHGFRVHKIPLKILSRLFFSYKLKATSRTDMMCITYYLVIHAFLFSSERLAFFKRISMARPAFKSSYRVSRVSVSSPSITGSTLSRVGSSVGRIFLNWIGWLAVSFLFIVESIYFNSLITMLSFRFQEYFRKSSIM